MSFYILVHSVITAESVSVSIHKQSRIPALIAQAVFTHGFYSQEDIVLLV